VSAKSLKWAKTPYDVLRKRHVERLRAIYAELHAEHEARLVEIAKVTSRLSNDFVASETAVRSSINLAAAGFVRACEHGAKMAVLADVLRQHGADVDGYGNLDGHEGGSLTLGIGILPPTSS